MTKKFRHKFISGILIGLLSFNSMQFINLTDIKIVYAIDSNEVQNIKIKLVCLVNSLKKNYLGLKNQLTWESYIKEIKGMIKILPYNDKEQGKLLLEETNKCEALVNTSAKINHVEKSMTPIKNGGYGNYLGIKNVDTWSQYVYLANEYLELVDKSVFEKQYNELSKRIEKVESDIEKIHNKYKENYNKVILIYENAVEENNLNKLKNTLKEAEKLGSCYRSEELIKNIKNFIKEREINTEKVLYVVNYKQLKRALLNNEYNLIKIMRDIDIEGDINIPKEKKLIVFNDIFFHNLYSEGDKLENYGQFVNYGIIHYNNIIENYGEMENYNEFYNDAKLKNYGRINNYGYFQNKNIIYNLGEIYNKHIFVNNGTIEESDKIKE